MSAVAWALVAVGGAMAMHMAALDARRGTSVDGVLGVLQDVAAGAAHLAQWDAACHTAARSRTGGLAAGRRVGSAPEPAPGWGAALRVHALSQQLAVLNAHWEARGGRCSQQRQLRRAELVEQLQAAVSALCGVVWAPGTAGSGGGSSSEQPPDFVQPVRHALIAADAWHQLGVAHSRTGSHGAAVIAFQSALCAYEMHERGAADGLQVCCSRCCYWDCS